MKNSFFYNKGYILRLLAIGMISVACLIFMIWSKDTIDELLFLRQTSSTVSSPVFSRESGFYEDEFEINISCEKWLTIYYSTDGSIPNQNSIKYDKPIHIYDKTSESNKVAHNARTGLDYRDYDEAEYELVDKAFVVKAICYDSDGNSSPVVTATYFVDKGEYADETIVSISADYEELMGEDGIYVTGKEYDEWYLGTQEGEEPKANFLKKGKDNEIPASITVIDNGNIFSQNVGIRVSGNSKRKLRKKPLNIYARKEYSGSSVFSNNLFEGIESHKVGLRTGFCNAMIQRLVKERDVATQASIPVTLFLNGEYQQKTFLQEKYDERYFVEHYDLTKGNIIVVNQGSTAIGKDDNGYYKKYKSEITDFISEHDLSTQEDYEAFCELVDIQSYVDHMCIRTYIDDMDFSEKKNAIMWRTKQKENDEYGDGKWRFALYDLDAMEWADYKMFDCSSQAEKNTFILQPRYAHTAISDLTIFAALKENDAFKKLYANTFMDLINVYFESDRVGECMDSLGIAPEDYGGKSREYYENFFAERPAYVTEYMKEDLGLTGTKEKLHVEVNDTDGGVLKINTVYPNLSGGMWEGEYFTDYMVTITAIPNEGYEFKGFEGSVCSSKESIEAEIEQGGTTIKAVFEKK